MALTLVLDACFMKHSDKCIKVSNEMGIPVQTVNWKGILDTAVAYVKILIQNTPGKTDINHIKPVPTFASTCLLTLNIPRGVL